MHSLLAVASHRLPTGKAADTAALRVPNIQGDVQLPSSCNLTNMAA
jgi:hypothetical protein